MFLVVQGGTEARALPCNSNVVVGQWISVERNDVMIAGFDVV